MSEIMREIFGNKLRKDATAGSMKDKCSTDFKLFCEYYLSDSFGNNWSTEFHGWLIDKLENITLEHTDEETRTVVAAPRGHAKSTLTTYAYVIWLTLYNYKKFIVIISATTTVAKQFLINIRNTLEYNEKIRADFGSLKSEDMWNNTELFTTNKVFITSKSAGTQLRGLNFNGTRPDTVILDDLETPEQVKSVAQTDALETWFESDVMPVGCPTVDFFYIGTVLSYESLLYHMLTKSNYSSWTRKRFQAVIKFSESPLWLEWEDIITDLERGDTAYEDSVAFYKKHKEEMLEGTEVLWEGQRPDMYKHLMERRIASEEGFASEYMNDPQTENTRVFKSAWLDNNYYVDEPEIKEVVIAIDPAAKKKRHNDYSVVLAVGRAKNGYFYVLEADAQRRSPDKLIEDARGIIAKYYSYHPKIIVETNQFQSFFASTLQRDMVNAGIYVDWVEVCHTTGDKKSSRIESLVPHIKNGYIKFKESQKILLGQLKNYPKGHDDAPDTLAMCMRELLLNGNNKFGFGSIGEKEKQDNGFIAKLGNLLK